MATQTQTMRTRQAGGGDKLVEAVLKAARKPIGAYEIRDRIVAQGARIAVPQVYRVLTRLAEQGRIRRIEALNAYVLGAPGDAVAVCRTCLSATPVAIGDLGLQIAALAETSGFRVERPVIELVGTCEKCL